MFQYISTPVLCENESRVFKNKASRTIFEHTEGEITDIKEIT